MLENGNLSGNAQEPRCITVPNLTPIKEIPLYDDMRGLLDGMTEQYGDDACFIIKTRRGTRKAPAEYKRISFRQQREDVDAFGAALLRLGLKGKRLAIIGKNRYEWMLAYYSFMCGLGVIVPLDKGLPFDETELSLQRAKADALCFDKELEPLAASLRDSGKFPDMTFICMEPCEGWLDVPSLTEQGRADASALAEYKELPIDGKALSIILFTSGTSGLAKAVMLSQYNITYNAKDVLSTEDLRCGDVNMAFLPYHHTFGSTGQVMMSLAGMTSVFCDGLKYIQRNIVEYKVSVFICVPLLIESIYKKIMQEIEKQGKMKTFRTGVKISRLLLRLGIDVRRKIFKEIHEKLGGSLRFVISGASPLDPAVAQGFTDLGISVVQGYGMTETSPVLAGENPEHLRIGTIGWAMPGVELRVEDPNEEGIGELVARGGNVMLGYYENEEATAEIFRGGWLHTGDLASVDADGYVTIRGRAKNVIVLKNGKNIYPEELEQEIGELPYVSECMVFGEPRRHDGDHKDLVVCVKIVYDAGRIKETRGAGTPEQIEAAVAEDIERINDEMPSYKHIYRRYISDEPMEKTTTGKIKRYKQKI